MNEFFELRIYQVFQGKMIEWLELMENTIIPFQVSKGMIIFSISSNHSIIFPGKTWYILNSKNSLMSDPLYN